MSVFTPDYDPNQDKAHNQDIKVHVNTVVAVDQLDLCVGKPYWLGPEGVTWSASPPLKQPRPRYVQGGL